MFTFKNFGSLLALLSAVIVSSCKNTTNDYKPSSYLTKDQQVEFKGQVVRYVAKAPRRVFDATKFDTLYDDHYDKQVAEHDLLAYYINNKGEHYFLLARIAPSIDVKWVATGGRLRYGPNNELVEYEEIFRTWKMPRQQLEERAKYLFDLMVRGEDLTPYHSAKAGFNYIEFPDEHVTYDKDKRSWVSDQYGSIEEMVYESRDADSLKKKSD
jgi:hypothetical protein